jgi:hypothetical protein
MIPYLQNDKQQDGRSTKVCLRFILLTIMDVWFGHVKFGTELNSNILRNICKIILLLNDLCVRQNNLLFVTVIIYCLKLIDFRPYFGYNLLSAHILSLIPFVLSSTCLEIIRLSSGGQFSVHSVFLCWNYIKNYMKYSFIQCNLKCKIFYVSKCKIFKILH